MPADNWKAWVRKNATNLLRVAIVLLFLFLAAWAISLNHFNRVIANHEPWLWLTTALVSVGPELAGIVIGVVTIDYLNERRQREQLKAQLIRQMGSNIRDVAVPAAKELAHHGWLYDGSLGGVDLALTNLSGADLALANLSRTGLVKADLSGAFFEYAILRGACLVFANLSGVGLFEADLSRAELVKANLTRAVLWNANLSGANLEGACLSEARLRKTNLSGISSWTIEQLEQVETLEGVIMPDGVQLGGKNLEIEERLEGPTFEEWKAQYLAKHRGTVTDTRDVPDGTDEGKLYPFGGSHA